MWISTKHIQSSNINEDDLEIDIYDKEEENRSSSDYDILKEIEESQEAKTLIDKTTARQLMEFRERPIKSALGDLDTLRILVHRHKPNNQGDLTKSRISVNIVHKTSIVMAKTMPLLIRYIMMRLFKKTYKKRSKEKTKYDFTTVKEYNALHALIRNLPL